MKLILLLIDYLNYVLLQFVLRIISHFLNLLIIKWMYYKYSLKCDFSIYKIAGIRVKRRSGCLEKIVSLEETWEYSIAKVKREYSSILFHVRHVVIWKRIKKAAMTIKRECNCWKLILMIYLIIEIMQNWNYARN